MPHPNASTTQRDLDARDDERDPERQHSPASAGSNGAPTTTVTGMMSPMTLLSIADTAFTASSIDSGDMYLPSTDEEDGHEPGRNDDEKRQGACQKMASPPGRGGEQGTATLVASISRTIAQSPATTRATAAALQRGHDRFLSPTSPGMSSDISNNNSYASSLISPPSSTSPVEDTSFDQPLLSLHRGHKEEASSTADQNNLPNQDIPDAARQRLVVLRATDTTLSDTGDANKEVSQTNTNHPNQITAAAIIRPKFTNKRPSQRPLQTEDAPTQTQTSSQQSSSSKPAIVRTTSSRGNLPLRHPVPDLNVRSGAFVGNIAQLEATAERFSMTSSIEDAIREAHQELKRSDSRKSSFLAASVKNTTPENEAGSSASQPPSFARQSSIVSINNAARSGGYSPSGYVMSPNHSLSGSRLRPESKSSASGSASGLGPTDGPDPLDDELPYISRHGPGKSSMRSVRSMQSNKLSLPEIVEVDLPMTLTQEALDEADRMIAAGEDPDDDDTIRASAHQHVDMDFDTGLDMGLDSTPHADTWARQPILDHSIMPQDYLNYAPTQQPMQNPMDYTAYQPGYLHNYERPATSGSGGTFEQAQTAFGDFDGVHCNPDHVDFPGMAEPEMPQPLQRVSRPTGPPPLRPKSYFDPGTGQQMMYYPARVPAMLNLPPKLSKQPKAAERNKKRSQVLSMMPVASRESRVWLPDPLEGELGSPLIEPEELPATATEKQPSLIEASESHEEAETQQAPAEQHPQLEVQPPPQQFRRPARLTDADKRKSRMSVMDGLPPQLRASAFFDLPSTTPKIEVKDGSAMATLDSILDASAKAPVSAFTDHAFAGKLGAEVYGAEKKRKKKTATDKSQAYLSTATALDAEKRSSFLSLLGHTRKNSEPVEAAADRRTVIGADSATDEEMQRLSGAIDGEALSPGLSEGADLAPEEDEQESSEEEVEDDEVYQGPPTTLLAELQIRKQQQKMRTRPVHQAFPNGLHTTLLELDAVAEVERKARKGKRVNLAWEDSTMNPDNQDEGDDEDVPLGMLYAAKAAGNNDISAVAAEMNRPLGLMQKKDMEDNEPLSRRRDRLQGRDPGVSMYLGAGLGTNGMNKRNSMLTLTPTIAALNQAGRISPGQPSPIIVTPEEPEEEEVEGETLADRMRRIKAKEENELPRARPVSGAFSAELLSQFGDPGEDGKAKEKGKGQVDRGKENAPPEEEETLGQRRRRLQAEKEAREREMASTGGLAVKGHALHPLTGSDRLSRRLSMADVLAAHPIDNARGRMDPREQERLRREEEAASVAREKEAKMALLRAQMPLSVPSTNPGGGVNKAGGYMGGRFNDGTGGGLGVPITRHNDGPGVGHWANGGGANRQSVAMSGLGSGYGGMQSMQQQPPMMGMGMNGMNGFNGNAFGGGYGAMGTHGMNGAYGNMNGFVGGAPLQMQMQQGQGQLDMVERWRQGVLP